MSGSKAFRLDGGGMSIGRVHEILAWLRHFIPENKQGVKQ